MDEGFTFSIYCSDRFEVPYGPESLFHKRYKSKSEEGEETRTKSTSPSRLLSGFHPALPPPGSAVSYLYLYKKI